MKVKIFTPLLITMVSVGAQADVDFSGFATFAAGKAFGGNTVDGFNPDDINFTDNSLMVIQGASDIKDKLGATIQIASRGIDDWEPDVTWAFLSYDVSDSWRLIAGRQRMPHYTYSDFIEVSYAYHWVTVPAELYNAPFDSFDGISSLYTMNFDSSTLTLQALVGEETSLDSVIRNDVEEQNSFTDIIGGKLIYNYDWLTLTLGYFEFVQSATVDDVIDTQGNLISYDIGLQIDYYSWFVVAELTSVDLSEIRSVDTGDIVGLGTLEPWMISLGKRFGDVMPHITYGENRSLDFFNTDEETPFYTVGVRWDFNPSAALKVEYSASEDRRFGDGESFQVAITTVF